MKRKDLLWILFFLLFLLIVAAIGLGENQVYSRGSNELICEQILLGQEDFLYEREIEERGCFN